MAVATRNPFELLNDDDSSSVTEAAPAPAPVVEAPRPTNTNNRTRNAGGPASRGGKYYARGGAAKSAPKTDQDGFVEAGNLNASVVPEERDSRVPGGRGRGGRGGARGGRGRGDRPERGRPFDKHSQTAHVDTQKTVEQGWGAETGPAELEAEARGIADAAAEVKEGDATPAVEGAEAAPKEIAEPSKKPIREEEEEDNTVSYEEYLVQQKKAASDIVPKLEGRQVENGSEWKDAVQLTKEEGDDVYFAGKTKAPPKARTKKEEKVTIEIDGHFNRPQSDRGRGGRGRGEGRGRGGDRGRGGPRGGDRRGGDRRENGGPRRSAAPAVDVDDTSAFPSLGA